LLIKENNMTDRNKFEEMLERLVNEDKEGAEALFHEIVVEKSRDIYESLLEDEEVEETTDEEVDEASDEEVDEDEELDEATDEDADLEETTDEEVEEGFFGEGDPADELGMDIEMPSGDEEGGMDMGMEPEMGDDDMGMGDEEGDVEDRVADLEDELEALKAEFETMMGDDAGEEGEEGDMDMDMGGEMPMDMDSEEGEEEPEEEAIAFETTDEEVEESTKSASEVMREYADKVAPAKMGDNGANAKSVTAKPNNMGGTSANIVKGGDGGTGGTQGGLAAPTAKPMNTKNVNVPGAKGATKMSNQPGHGAEKKGAAPNQDAGAGSPLNGAPKRAK
jgi:hypothetical protein